MNDVDRRDDTAKEHLAWSKERTRPYLDRDQPTQAWASMVSDLRAHPATKDHPAIMLGFMLAMSGHLQTTEQVRDFVDGFH